MWPFFGGYEEPSAFAGGFFASNGGKHFATYSVGTARRWDYPTATFQCRKGSQAVRRYCSGRRERPVQLRSMWLARTLDSSNITINVEWPLRNAVEQSVHLNGWFYAGPFIHPTRFPFARRVFGETPSRGGQDVGSAVGPLAPDREGFLAVKPRAHPVNSFTA